MVNPAAEVNARFSPLVVRVRLYACLHASLCVCVCIKCRRTILSLNARVKRQRVSGVGRMRDYPAAEWEGDERGAKGWKG